MWGGGNGKGQFKGQPKKLNPLEIIIALLSLIAIMASPLLTIIFLETQSNFGQRFDESGIEPNVL